MKYLVISPVVRHQPQPSSAPCHSADVILCLLTLSPFVTQLYICTWHMVVTPYNPPETIHQTCSQCRCLCGCSLHFSLFSYLRLLQLYAAHCLRCSTVVSDILRVFLSGVVGHSGGCRTSGVTAYGQGWTKSRGPKVLGPPEQCNKKFNVDVTFHSITAHLAIMDTAIFQLQSRFEGHHLVSKQFTFLFPRCLLNLIR